MIGLETVYGDNYVMEYQLDEMVNLLNSPQKCFLLIEIYKHSIYSLEYNHCLS